MKLLEEYSKGVPRKRLIASQNRLGGWAKHVRTWVDFKLKSALLSSGT